MRTAFIQTLTELASSDPRILLLTGDLGYMALEPFMEKHPDRFFNVGVAEQNMVGLATGLAESGFIPFVYSITPFAVLRPYEFIRNGPIQHQLPVRIVGIGGGLEYGQNGLSHYGLEDVAVMRAQPAISIIAPADHLQTRQAVAATWNLPGPIYYRLGKIQCIREGNDLLLIAMGSVSSEAAAAAAALEKEGVNCALAILASVSPAPVEELAALLVKYPAVMTVEAHYRVGGAGSLVAELIAERGLRSRLVRCAVDSMPSGITGSQRYLHRRYGLSSDKLVETALSTVGK